MEEDPNKPPKLEDSKPQPLQYRSGSYVEKWEKGPGRAVEITVGFVSYFGVVSATFLLLRGDWRYSNFAPWIVWIVLLPLAVLAGLAIYLHGNRGWRGFIPGVLLGLGLSCLIGTGGLIWIVATCKI